MRKIGQIIQLQVQVDSLKQGEKNDRYYDPAGLRAVAALRLMPEGVTGLEAGQELSDVHHANNQNSKNRALTNGISFNFTSHYTQMQARFGAHLSTGIAGENILVATEQTFDEATFAGGVIIETQDGQQVVLSQVCVAEPCAPFSTFALNQAARPVAAELKAALQFLDGGTRGFYCQQTGAPIVIQVGDTMFVG